MSTITPQLVLFSLVGLGQAAIQAFNNDTATHRAPLNATAFYKSPGQVLSIPLKHVERKGGRTPSIAKRYFGSEVLGVYGAAYFAECTDPPPPPSSFSYSRLLVHVAIWCGEY